MRRNWWKALGVLLLLYVVLIGLRTPLAPTIVHVDTDRITPGPVRFIAQGYGTAFSTEQPPMVWLENSGQRLCAAEVTVLDPLRIRVELEIPEGFRSELSHLHVLDTRAGQSMVLHEAFWTGGRGSGIQEATCPATAFSPSAAFTFPNRAILNETIRNLFFHVPMWFTMMLLMTISVVHSVRALGAGGLRHDVAAVNAVRVGLVFAALGLVTGMVWARATWGTWWTSDPQLNGAATVTLIYLAYLVLRGSVADPGRRARLAAVYNLFAFALMLVFFMVLPRLSDSLHPGKGGNPAFSTYDLDDHLRLVFYPAVLGWMLLGTWMFNLRLRAARLSESRP
ncbi:MAG: cytochrome c biogenesis protein CcsA [Flavobacteriales bacterium]|nr:cytochrome c biogenesis protein CcsA [Flavobacteriales bacterium]